jgi:hypothetical protein
MKMAYKRTKNQGRLNRILQAVYFVYCRIRFGGNIRLIPLTKFRFIIVDAEDYDRLKQFKWYAVFSSKTCYAYRNVRIPNSKKYKKVAMHRVILQPPDGLLIDHVNHNGLDNRKANLRLATTFQNSCNRRKNAEPHRDLSAYPLKKEPENGTRV